MLRVLMTVDAVGGVWRYALDLARLMAPFDVRLLLVGFGPAPQPRQQAECEALPHVELVWTDQPLDWTVDDSSVLDSGTEQLAALAADWRADLLHLNVPSQAAGLAGAVPVVAVSHSCVPTWWAAVRGTALPDDWAWHLERNRQGLDRADIVVVPSDSHGQALARQYGRLRDCRAVYNATSVGPGDEPKQKLIVSAGRWWDEGKNGAVLDRAAPSTPWPILLAGALTGPQGQSVRFDRVETTGSLAHYEVQALLRRAAVFAAPSLYEPFGLAVAEAASHGAALVLSDIPTFRELWHDAAVFVPPTEAARWAEAFQRLASDEVMRQQLAGAARQRAAQFAPDQQAKRMWAVYQDLRPEARA